MLELFLPFMPQQSFECVSFINEEQKTWNSFSHPNIRRENQYTFYVKRDRRNTNDFFLFRVVEFACFAVYAIHEIRFVFVTQLAMHCWRRRKSRKGEKKPAVILKYFSRHNDELTAESFLWDHFEYAESLKLDDNYMTLARNKNQWLSLFHFEKKSAKFLLKSWTLSFAFTDCEISQSLTFILISACQIHYFQLFWAFHNFPNI